MHHFPQGFKIIILLLFIILTFQLNLHDLMRSMENKVISITQNMVQLYKTRCSNSNILNCNIKSINICEGTSTRTCESVFPTPSNCSVEGSYISIKSGFRLPNSVSLISIPQDHKMFICASAYLQEKLIELFNQNIGENTFQYFGSSTGGIRLSPSFKYQRSSPETCQDYDPRLRPWYASGTSGAKNLIILLPITGIIKSSNRLSYIKNAALVIIKTLSNYDFFNIILYNNTTRTINSTLKNLQRASQMTVQIIKKNIDEISSDDLIGGSNYEKAFSQAFRIFNESGQDKFGAPCQNAQNILLMFVDSNPNVGEQNLTNLISKIDAQNTYSIVLFTYGIVPGSDLKIAKFLACQYNGIFFNITTSDQTQIASSISSYYTYLAQGVKILKPTWSAPYNDSFGFGRLVTVSFPAYLTEHDTRKIIGVAGIDVRVQYLIDQTDFETEQQVELQMLQNITCSNTSIFRNNSCILEGLRPEYSKCSDISEFSNYSSCPKYYSNIQCKINNTSQVIIAPQNTQNRICCPFLNIGLIIGLVMGITGFLIIMVGTSILVYKKWKQRQRQAAYEVDNIKEFKRANKPQEINDENTFQNVINFPRQGQLLTAQQRKRWIQSRRQKRASINYNF